MITSTPDPETILWSIEEILNLLSSGRTQEGLNALKDLRDDITLNIAVPPKQ